MKLFGKLLARRIMDSVAWLDSNELLTLMNSASPPVIIDVRGPGEFNGPLGHIESARNIPLHELPDRTSELLSENRSLVLICHTDRRSAAAADHLRRAGGMDIAVLSGGMVAWRSEWSG